jgi:hypothetical protein
MPKQNKKIKIIYKYGVKDIKINDICKIINNYTIYSM